MTKAEGGREFSSCGGRGREEGHDSMSEPGEQGQPRPAHRKAPRVGRIWFASPSQERDPGAKNGPPSRLRGVRAEGTGWGVNQVDWCDTFQPPSPAPSGVVTEPAPLRERERVGAFGRSTGPCTLSHQLQSCENKDFARQRAEWAPNCQISPCLSSPMFLEKRMHQCCIVSKSISQLL